MKPGDGEFARGWPVILCGIVGMMVQGFAFLSIGTMMTPLMAEFGWSRTEIVAVAPMSALLSPLIAPIAGTLIDRHGPRKVALWGFAAYATAVGSAGLVGPGIAGWWLVWAAISATTFLVGPLIWTFAVMKSFVTRRGMALGLVLSGMGIAIAIVPLFLVGAITHLGWRGGYFALAAAVLIVGWGTTYFGFRLPETGAAEREEVAAETGVTRGEALRTWRFWGLALVLLLSSGAVGTLAVHLQPLLIDLGATMLGAAAVAAAFGPAQVVGRLLGGYLLDHVPGTILGFVVFLFPLAGCAILLAGWGGSALGMLAPISFGLAAGLELDLGAYMCGRYFGRRHFGRIFASLYIFHVVGYTVGPLGAAMLRDASGAYVSVLVVIAVMLPIAAVTTGLLGRYPDSPPARN